MINKDIQIEGQNFSVPQEVAEYIAWLENFVDSKDAQLKAIVNKTERSIANFQEQLNGLDIELYQLQGQGIVDSEVENSF